ncbi:MAG TPA: FG-GAP-like repeat-containing protein [Polyangiaceae bacterium]
MQRSSRGFHLVALASLIALAPGIGCSGGGDSGEPSARTGGSALAPGVTPKVTAATTTPPTVPTNTIIADATGVLPPTGDGALSVGDRGDAHQHIPIWVPPGRAGMQPQLSLEYSSTGASGLLGVGWSLAGLSRITRCKALRQNYKIAPPVQWNWGDSFCLDGEPLVTDSDRFTYRKFHDDGSLIVRWPAGQSPDGNPLDYWEMRTKSGRIFKFGATADSRVTVSRNLATPAVMTYALSRVQDFPGNFMSVTYQNATGGDILPQRIDYTGSAADPGTYRSVSFFYDTTRPDVDQRAFAGQYFSYVERLVRLEMNAPNIARVSPLRSFSLGYTVSPSTGRSLLSNIAECDGPAPTSIPVTGSTPLCRQESFTYAQGVPVATSGAFEVDDTDTTGAQITDVSPLGAEGVGPTLHTLDVDGDGRDDVLYLPTAADEHYVLRLSAGRAFGQAIETDIPVSIPTPNPAPGAADSAPIVLDFNGDGHADVLVNQGTPDAPAAHLYLANDGAQNQGPWTLGGAQFEAPLWTGYSHYQSADLNGDGLPDLVMFAGGNAYYSINTNGVFSYLTQPALITVPTNNDYIENFTNYFLDFNGDGVTDIMTRVWTDNACVGHKTGDYNCDCRGMSYGGLDVFPDLYTGSGPSTSTGIGGLTVCTGALDEITKYTPLFGDFNGDGIADVVQTYVPYDPNGNPQPMHFELSLGDGTGDFTAQGAAGDFTISSNALGFETMDADLDGKADLVIRGPGNLPYTVYSWKSQAWHPSTIAIAENPLLYAASVNLFAPGDVNGDGAPDIVTYTATDSAGHGKLAAYERITSGPRPDLLTNTKGDFGPTATVKYAPYLVSPNEDRSDCQAPLACVTRAGSLVSEIDVDNGVNGGTNAQEHTYASGRADMLGWGFVGFKTHTIKDDATGTVTTRTFDLSENTTSLATPFFPLVGTPVEVDSTVSYMSGAKSVTRTSTSSTTYTVQTSTWGVFMALATASSTKTIDSNSIQPLALESIQRAFDAYGSVTSETDTFPTDSETRVTTTTYLNDTTNWIIGRPTYVSVTDTQGSTTPTSATREKAYTYDANGLLAVEIGNPGAANNGSYDPLPPQQDGVQTLYTRTTRDADGMPTLVEQVDNLTTPNLRRATAYQYDTQERMFVVLTTDPAGLVTGSAYEYGLGVLAAQTDPAGVLTTYQYDTFGRIRADHPAAGGDRSVAYHAATLGNFGSIEDHRLGQYDVTGTLDSLHRPVSTKTTGRADGKAVLSETTYDTLGRVTVKTRPHFTGASDGQTVTSYDNVGRVTQVVGPDGSSQTTAYLGRVVTTTNPDGDVTQIQNDSQGHPMSSTQAMTSGPAGLSGPVTTTLMTYGPFFELVQTTDTDQNVVKTTFDRLGRPMMKQDADTNVTAYTYDVFGEVTDELRGATLVLIISGGHVTPTLYGGEHTTMTYDGDGRTTSKTAPDVGQVWTWDTVYPGKLSNATVSGGTSITYAYDPFGNVKSKTWDGPRGAIGYSYTYDKYDRLSTTTYPALPSATKQPALVVKNTYSGGDLGGQLTGVSDVTNPTSPSAYWTLKSTDATETFPVSTLRNNVQTTLAEDPSHPGWLKTITSKVGSTTVQSLAYSRGGAGRVNGRQDTVNGTTETFGYDGLERLTSWTWQGAVGARAVQYVYDDIGNLSQRNVVTGPGTSVTYTYGGNGMGPHQVSDDGSGTAFAYDAQGNELVAPGRSFEFNSFDRATSVTASAGKYTMTYDADLARFSRTDPAGGVRYSYGRLFQEFNDSAGTHYVMTIMAAGNPVAEVEKLVSANVLKSTTVNTILLDALGSLDALVGSNGQPLPEKYDPFGARVKASDPTVRVTAPPRDLRIGFTGHEQDDDVDLVDMIGRLYDPVQQRFLSADPPAPDPVDGQAYNPYAYVRNNPLNATDPTGYVEMLLNGLPSDVTIRGSSLGVSPNAGDMWDGADTFLAWVTVTVYSIPYGAYPGEDPQGTSGMEGPGALAADSSKVGVVDASGAAKNDSNPVVFAKYDPSALTKEGGDLSDNGRGVLGPLDLLLEPFELQLETAKTAAEFAKDPARAMEALKAAKALGWLVGMKSFFTGASASLTGLVAAFEHLEEGGSVLGSLLKGGLAAGVDWLEEYGLATLAGPIGVGLYVYDGIARPCGGQTCSAHVTDFVFNTFSNNGAPNSAQGLINSGRQSVDDFGRVLYSKPVLKAFPFIQSVTGTHVPDDDNGP